MLAFTMFQAEAVSHTVHKPIKGIYLQFKKAFNSSLIAFKLKFDMSCQISFTAASTNFEQLNSVGSSRKNRLNEDRVSLENRAAQT